jgi:hypothetical protein
MNSYSDYIVRMLPDLPGCPDNIIMQQVQQGARDFCSDSEAWIEELDPINIVSGTVTYDLSKAYSYNADVHRILEVVYDDGTLDTSSYDLVNQRYLELVTTPTSSLTDGLEVKVALIPKYEATQMSEMFMTRYARGIMARAKMLLMLQPNKPWSNPDLAIYNKNIYENEIVDSVSDKHQEFKDMGLMVNLRGGIY